MQKEIQQTQLYDAFLQITSSDSRAPAHQIGFFRDQRDQDESSALSALHP